MCEANVHAGSEEMSSSSHAGVPPDFVQSSGDIASVCEANVHAGSKEMSSSTYAGVPPNFVQSGSPQSLCEAYIQAPKLADNSETIVGQHLLGITRNTIQLAYQNKLGSSHSPPPLAPPKLSDTIHCPLPLFF